MLGVVRGNSGRGEDRVLWGHDEGLVFFWTRSATNHDSSTEGSVDPVWVSDQVGGDR